MGPISKSELPARSKLDRGVDKFIGFIYIISWLFVTPLWAVMFIKAVATYALIALAKSAHELPDPEKLHRIAGVWSQGLQDGADIFKGRGIRRAQAARPTQTGDDSLIVPRHLRDDYQGRSFSNYDFAPLMETALACVFALWVVFIAYTASYWVNAIWFVIKFIISGIVAVVSLLTSALFSKPA